MKLIKRIGAAALALTMAASLFTACGDEAGYDALIPTRTSVEIDGETVNVPYVLKIGEREVSLDEYRFYLLSAAGQYDVDADFWLDAENYEMLKEDVLEAFRVDYANYSMADEAGIALTSEEVAAFQEEFVTLRNDYETNTGSQDGLRTLLAQSNMTDKVYMDILGLEQTAQKTYDALYGLGGANAPSVDELYEDMQGTFVRAKHILIYDTTANEDGSLTGVSLALDILAQLNNGADFDELVGLYNEDPGMTSYPEGYYFTAGEMVQEFEDATFALEEGAISGIVETSYGYHIIQRLPLEKSYVEDHFGEIYNNVEGYIVIRTQHAAALEIEFSEQYELLTYAALLAMA